MECIVLAGGLGTRLRGTIGDYPKCMAEVNGKPFLHYIFEYLREQNCTKTILSLGYKHEVITEWLKTESRPFEIEYIIEHEPLGTGGGIQSAIKKAIDENIVVLNGDTMFQADLKNLFYLHLKKNAGTTLALKEMKHFERYGSVSTDASNLITAFEEKRYRESGLINGGVYIVNKAYLLSKHLPEKFSFEKDYLEAFVNEKRFAGYNSDAYFIDIGIPEDYERSQIDFKLIFQ